MNNNNDNLTNTSIADNSRIRLTDTLRLAGMMVQYDNFVKSLLSEKIILAFICKECMDELKDCPVEVIAETAFESIETAPDKELPEYALSKDAPSKDSLPEDSLSKDPLPPRIIGLNTEEITVEEMEKASKSMFDLKTSVTIPEIAVAEQMQKQSSTEKRNKMQQHEQDTSSQRYARKLFLNLEAHKDNKNKYPLSKRGIFYCSKIVVLQKDTIFTKMDYKKIRKVYSIWIQCNSSNKNEANSVIKYSLAEDVKAGNCKGRPEDYDIMTVIIIRLGDTDQAKDVPLLRFLDILLSTKISVHKKYELLEQEFGIKPPVDKERSNEMCDVAKGIYEMGYDDGQIKGFNDGKIKGFNDGKIKGFNDGKILIATNLKNLGKNSIEDIAACTGLSVEEVQALKKQS